MLKPGEWGAMGISAAFSTLEAVIVVLGDPNAGHRRRGAERAKRHSLQQVKWC